VEGGGCPRIGVAEGVSGAYFTHRSSVKDFLGTKLPGLGLVDLEYLRE
jgi:hypothetical protein